VRDGRVYDAAVMSTAEAVTAFRDHYAVLGVDSDADDAQIKAAFWDLAKRYHPDVNQGGARAARRFAEINEARTVLLSSARRAHFDRERDAFLRTGVHVPLPAPLEASPIPVPRHAALGRALLAGGVAAVLLTVLLLPLASMQARPDPTPVHAFDAGVLAGVACCVACVAVAGLGWPALRGVLDPSRWEALVAFLVLWFAITVAGQVDPHILLGGLFSSDLSPAGGGDVLVLSVGVMLAGAVLLQPTRRR
jgi:DnaJ domain